MSEFTITFRRTVRVAPYETIVMGLSETFKVGEIERDEALRVIKGLVNTWIFQERDRIWEEEKDERSKDRKRRRTS